jgi:hypothetical protein
MEFLLSLMAAVIFRNSSLAFLSIIVFPISKEISCLILSLEVKIVLFVTNFDSSFDVQ